MLKSHCKYLSRNELKNKFVFKSGVGHSLVKSISDRLCARRTCKSFCLCTCQTGHHAAHFCSLAASRKMAKARRINWLQQVAVRVCGHERVRVCVNNINCCRLSCWPQHGIFMFNNYNNKDVNHRLEKSISLLPRPPGRRRRLAAARPPT